MTQPAPPSPKPRVLALVVARRGDEIADVLASIESQVYEVEDVVVIADQRPDVAPETARPKTARRLSEAWTLSTVRWTTCGCWTPGPLPDPTPWLP